MDTSIKDMIRRRKSVRTFSGESFRSEDREKLDGFFKTADKPFDTLFFENSSAQSLSPEIAVVCGDKVHFYEKKAKAMQNNPPGDIQKVDMGIALAHFNLTLKETGSAGRFVVEDPGFEADDQLEYIVTCEVNR